MTLVVAAAGAAAAVAVAATTNNRRKRIEQSVYECKSQSQRFLNRQRTRIRQQPARPGQARPVKSSQAAFTSCLQSSPALLNNFCWQAKPTINQPACQPAFQPASLLLFSNVIDVNQSPAAFLSWQPPVCLFITYVYTSMKRWRRGERKIA